MSNKPWRWMPSNGSEGEAFWEQWCMNCARDLPMSQGKNIDECSDDEKCQILADSFVCETIKEWVVGKNGRPECTAFVHVDEETPAQRCQLTIDMFDQQEDA